MRQRAARFARFFTALQLAAALSAGSSGAEPVCRSVAHIGDSLTAYRKAELVEAYASVGLSAEIDAFGGRATLQKLRRDAKTGKQAALELAAAGGERCWVVALGTNDTANVAAGARYTRAGAIDAMMAAIDPTGTAPVMWVNTFTTLRTGYWSSSNMRLWNAELLRAKKRWPNLRVFDWAAIAATGAAPFADGIHHTSEGYAARNKAIAEALAATFQR